MKINRIEDAKDLSGKRVFVRVDFNVPVKDGQVLNTFRIKALLPTIEFLKQKGARIILGSHIDGIGGRDMGPVSLYLKNILPHTYLSDTDITVIKEHIERMSEGDITLLPNLRLWQGEVMCDERFAIDFSKFLDIYVNEAFSSSHRNHASIVLFPNLIPAYAGMRFIKEIENLSRAFNPEVPFLFILGGAKFETKQPLIRKFLNKATTVFVGGAIANDFFLERGYEVGVSLLSSPRLKISDEIFNNERLILPIDVTVRTSDGKFLIKKPDEVTQNEKIVDSGPETINLLRNYAEKAKLIIWNGPLGVYEEGATVQTEELAIAIAESAGVSIAGGGDTITSISHLKLESAFDFFSTGGGAMLEFFAEETLPGIEALQR